MTNAHDDPNAPILGPYLSDVAASLHDVDRGLGQLLATVATTPQQKGRWHRHRSPRPGATPGNLVTGHAPTATGSLRMTADVALFGVVGLMVVVVGAMVVARSLGTGPDELAATSAGASPSIAAESEAPAASFASDDAPSPEPAMEVALEPDIVVAQDGTGDFTTIEDAIAAAASGDMIGVRPGRYAEPVSIGKGISVVGLAPRDQVVIVRTGELDAPAESLQPVITMRDASRLADVTVLDELAFPYGPPPSEILVDGQTSTIIERVGVDLIRLAPGSQAIVQDNDVGSIVVEAGGSPTIERNRVEDIQVGDVGDADGAYDLVRNALVIDNDVSGQIDIAGFGTLVEGNRVTRIHDAGRGSLVSNNRAGLIDLGGVGTIVRDNVVEGGEYGIFVTRAASDVSVEGNDVSGRYFGIAATGPGMASIRANSIHGSEIGLLAASTAAEYQDNAVCENADDVVRTWEAHIDVQANDICQGDVRIAGQPDAKVATDASETDADGFVFQSLEPGIRRLIHDGAGHAPRARWIWGPRDIGRVSIAEDGSVRVWDSPTDIDDQDVARLSFAIDGARAWTLGVPGEAIGADSVGDVRDDHGPLWARGRRALDPNGPGARKIVQRVGAGDDGMLWAIVATHDGWRPARYNGKRWKIFAPPPGARGFQLEKGIVDAWGNVWVWRDRGGGIGVYDGRSVRTIGVGRTLIPAAFDEDGRLWATEVLENEDDPRGIVVIDAELVKSTSLEQPIADVDLVDLFPVRVAGQKLDVATLTGRQWRRQFQPGPRRSEPPKPAVEDLLEVAGRSIDDVTVGYTSFAPSPDNRAYLAAVRVRGSDAVGLLDAIVPLMLGSIAEPSSEVVEIADRSVNRITDAARPGVYPQYTYATGDIIWVIDAEQPVLTEILKALP